METQVASIQSWLVMALAGGLSRGSTWLDVGPPANDAALVEPTRGTMPGCDAGGKERGRGGWS